jgi:dihydrofolate synthase / folylpolyglutamate synthase
MDAFKYLLDLEKFGIKFGLANIRTLALALGQPQNRFRSILIAGTNGKGSVTAMVDRALRAAGLSVARYTSPHLVNLEERFAINGEPVSTAALVNVIEDVRAVIETLLAKGALDAPPTFFEVTTAIAFELFSRAGIDVAVLEVGLGGRLDSTNIVDPVAAAVTSIDFDHEQYLGNTLAAIAAEKAGVIRRGIPVVAGPLQREARDVLATACASIGADFIESELGVRIKSTIDDGRTSLHVITPVRDYGWVPLGLRGDHQVPNALVAVRLLEAIERIVPLTVDAIRTGLHDVRWPGRLQMLEVPDGRRVLLDAAHNPAGAYALAAYLRREFPEALPMVFGALRDKDAALMLKAILPVSSRMVLTEPPSTRARPAEELAALVRKLSPNAKIEIASNPREALERAWTDCPVACVAGSIFLVGAILGSLGPGAREL